ncbi:MAG TPA: hypothetical protein VJY62_09200 [Bacteroidia bacterium]|nr:hypothetical protein [Bacteroidia bacterium]
MEKKRFYIDTSGNDDQAYREAMQFACHLAEENPEIKTVILLALSKKNVGWLDRLYGSKIVKNLFEGDTFKNCIPVFKIETINTYKDTYDTSEIVISLGLPDEWLFKIDDFYSVRAIIAIPWLKEDTQKWVQTWEPDELRGNQTVVEGFPEPSCIVIKAMIELTGSINMSTGITHPSDERLAKTIILSLHKYEPELNGDVVASYLVRKLGWESEYANEMKGLIDTLNAGKYFKGGDRTGLQHYYKQWKKQCL